VIEPLRNAVLASPALTGWAKGEAMSNAGILIGWTRAFNGKETIALSKFGEFTMYVTKLQKEKHIDSFEPVIMRPHGGDLNGFFLIRGDAAKLAAVRATDQWKDWEAWGAFNLQGFGVIECAIGEAVGTEIGRFTRITKG
jgi:hypothetical protein